MTNWLLDTNILSELRRKNPSERVLAFVRARPLESLYVSDVTLAEIRFGIENTGNPAQRAELKEWLDQRVRPMFDNRALPVTEDVILKWRVLVEDGRQTGHTFSQPDLFIAATALLHGLTVVTRNTNDYEKTRVPLFNPWNG